MHDTDHYTVVIGKRRAHKEAPGAPAIEPMQQTTNDAPETSGPRGNIFVDIIKFALVAFMIVTPFRLYVAQPFIVSGSSMQPTFEQNEYLIVDQISYHFEKPERGDVIIFKYPLDTSSFFIKRVIGLPGETVEIVDGKVYVYEAGQEKHEALVEPYRDTDIRHTNTTVVLEDDEYYVMGDNRSVSSDSRVWGPLKEKYIVGRAVARLLPVDMVQLFPGKYSFEDVVQP